MLGFNPLYRAVLGLMGGPQAALSLDFLAGSSLNPSVVTFSRASHATQFDSLGRLVWAPHNFMLSPVAGNATVSVTTEVPPPPGFSGTIRKLTAITNDPQLGFFSNTATQFLSGVRSYTFQAWVLAVGSSIGKTASFWLFRDGVTDVQNSASVVLTGQWQFLSATLTMTTAPTTNITARIDIPDTAAVGDVVYIAGYQLEYASANSPQPFSTMLYGPRFDYNPATLSPRGLLFEAQRTNLITRSDFWGVVFPGPSVVPNAVGPDGFANSAYTFTEGTSSVQHISGCGTTGTATTAAVHNLSAFVKAGTATRCQLACSNVVSGEYANFSLVGAGSVLVQNASNSAVIQKLGNGWFRIGMNVTAAASSGNLFVAHINDDAAARLPTYLGTGLTLQIFGGQVELGAFASSYIPSFVATTTRSGDISDLVSAPPYNSAGMTYYAEFEREGFATASSGEAASSMFYWGDVTDYVNAVYGFGTPSQQRCDIGGGGSAQFQVSGPDVAVPFTVYKWATRFALNDARMAQNGVLGTSDTLGTLPAALGTTRYSIGRANAASAQQMNGWLRAVRVYTQALPDATLQALTS
jgi:hypothetical protein